MIKRTWQHALKQEALLVFYVFACMISGFMALSFIIWGFQYLNVNRVWEFIGCMLAMIVLGRLFMLFAYWAGKLHTKIKKEQKHAI